MTSMTICIVGKKIRAMGPGPLELFPFVVLAIKFCIFLNFVSKISQELLYLEICTHDKYDYLYCEKENKGHGARILRVIFLCCSCY